MYHRKEDEPIIADQTQIAQKARGSKHETHHAASHMVWLCMVSTPRNNTPEVGPHEVGINQFQDQTPSVKPSETGAVGQYSADKKLQSPKASCIVSHHFEGEAQSGNRPCSYH